MKPSLPIPAHRFAAWLLRRGSRTVQWPQPNANLGNFLYEWMHAWTEQQRGRDVVCLLTAPMQLWLPQFGAEAERLVVARERLRLTDRRDKSLHNEFGVTFTADDLDAFIAGFIEPSGIIDRDRVPASQRLVAADLLVNVRRGDYVTNPENWRSYGFDLAEYLTAALDASCEVDGPIGRLHVVSDDIAWCRTHLQWLSERCDRLTFEDEGLPPATHLALLAHAPRLVLTNSTFSYWGGYLAGWRTGRRESVVAPWFHLRGEFGGAAWQLDPRWTIVRDLPSGWALPPRPE